MRILTLILTVVLTFPAIAQAAESTPTEADIEAMQATLEIRQLELEIAAAESEMDFQRQMHEVELEQRRAKIAHPSHRDHKGGKGIFLLLWLVVHALATVWVYKDLHERKTGSGLWIPIVLIGGLLGLLVYAVIRLSDIVQAKSQVS